MPGRAGRATLPRAPAADATGPALVPCLLLKKGDVYLPGADGPVPARSADGSSYDPFDILDRLVAEYPIVYLVDLEGVETGEPQLDLLQELARDATLWVDGGVRTAEQAIDILITGARRAVLSSSTLRGARELRRSWKLSTEFVFELELDARGPVLAGEWETTDPAELVRSVRTVGVDHLVVSPRGIDPDWTFVGAMAAGGPTWVDGSFSAADLPALRKSGARGGIFHLDQVIGPTAQPPEAPLSTNDRALRDDET